MQSYGLSRKKANGSQIARSARSAGGVQKDIRTKQTEFILLIMSFLQLPMAMALRLAYKKTMRLAHCLAHSMASTTKQAAMKYKTTYEAIFTYLRFFSSAIFSMSNLSTAANMIAKIKPITTSIGR